MLQQETPNDFVIVTGVQCSVRDFVHGAAKQLGMEIRWEGQGVNEAGLLCAQSSALCPRTIVAVDPRYLRTIEVETLHGDPTKAKDNLAGRQIRRSTKSSQKWCVKISILPSATKSSSTMAIRRRITKNKPRRTSAGTGAGFLNIPLSSHEIHIVDSGQIE
jgi:hypothetical protein